MAESLLILFGISQRQNQADVFLNEFVQLLMDLFILVSVFSFNKGLGDGVDSNKVVEQVDESFAQIDVSLQNKLESKANLLVEAFPHFLILGHLGILHFLI